MESFGSHDTEQNKWTAELKHGLSTDGRVDGGGHKKQKKMMKIKAIKKDQKEGENIIQTLSFLHTHMRTHSPPAALYCWLS